MIGTKLMGGMGNQMFQYAAARRLAIMRSTSVSMDLQFYDNQHPDDTQRSYELDQFKNISPRFIPHARRPKPSVYIGKKGVIKKVLDLATGKYWIFYSEQSHNYDSNLNYLPNHTYLSGYWQSEKYFSDIRQHILKDFEFSGDLSKKQLSIKQKIENTESVSLHIRRGDYVTNPHANKVHGLKGIEYYDRAVKLIKKGIHEPTLFIFSDDLVWCRKNLKYGVDTVFVDVNSSGYEDMWFMSLCKHNIIANSSFSWWAAWLNQNPAKTVVAPKVWFNDAEEGLDRVPNEWQRV